MANDAEMRVRFNRVISAIRAVIDSLIAQDAAWEELKRGTAGVYAGSAIACSKARQAFEDETPTMNALVIALRDNCYKDPTWTEDGEDDAKTLRLCWYSIHKTIEAGKSFAPDDVPMMQNFCAALERARKKYSKAKGVGRPKGADLSKYETECLRQYQAGKKPTEIDEDIMKLQNPRRGKEPWKPGTAEKVIRAAKARGELPKNRQETSS